MALTYVEIEQQKNTRILLFFAVVLLFYFLTALVLANVIKLFIATYLNIKATKPFLSGTATLKVFAFALVAASVHIHISLVNAINFIRKNLKAQIIDPNDRYHKRFQTIVDEVNVATGNKYKINAMVIPSVALNAFAISSLDHTAIVGVTEGLLSKLNRQQLQAVVAHEVAHVASGDSLQTTIGCSLFGIYAAMLNGVKNALSGGHSRYYGRGSVGLYLFLILIYVALSVMQSFYGIIRFAISRERELRADAIAVRLTRDPLSLSEALFAISQSRRGLGSIEPVLESLFIMNPLSEDIDEEEGFWANLYSTHPPIKKRIRLLAAMAHIEVKGIQETVLAQQKLKDKTREMPSETKKPQWFFYNQKQKWQGPFTIAQIMALGWLKPDTWISPINNQDKDQIIQARNEPLLQPIFDHKIKPLKNSGFNCPKCNQGLVDEEYEGTRLYRCLFCEGILVERHKVSRILLRKEKGFSERIKKMAALTQKNGLEKKRRKARIAADSIYLCPKCRGHSRMLRSFYSPAYLLEVDECSFCGIVWFDADELEILQYLIENKQVAKI